jgi:hypothetical protein
MHAAYRCDLTVVDQDRRRRCVFDHAESLVHGPAEQLSSAPGAATLAG